MTFSMTGADTGGLSLPISVPSESAHPETMVIQMGAIKLILVMGNLLRPLETNEKASPMPFYFCQTVARGRESSGMTQTMLKPRAPLLRAIGGNQSLLQVNGTMVSKQRRPKRQAAALKSESQ